MAAMHCFYVGAIILDCLKDPDVSIRQRALELTYQLVDASNIVELVRELLNYLVVAPPEHQSLLCSRVLHCAAIPSGVLNLRFLAHSRSLLSSISHLVA